MPVCGLRTSTTGSATDPKCTGRGCGSATRSQNRENIAPNSSRRRCLASASGRSNPRYGCSAPPEPAAPVVERISVTGLWPGERAQQSAIATREPDLRKAPPKPVAIRQTRHTHHEELIQVKAPQSTGSSDSSNRNGFGSSASSARELLRSASCLTVEETLRANSSSG